MTIKIKFTGLGGMTRALEALRTEGLARVQTDLDAALERTAETSRALAHVSHDHRHSGALRASQEVSSEHGSTTWTGSVAYGDRGARWELEAGGEHAAFIDSLAGLSDADMERALLDGFRP